jgi:VRR-NUC domain/FAN1, HTH domain
VPVLRSDRPPPPNYYADNLCRLLCEVARQYSDILTQRERDYIRRVTGLAAAPLRLYARLVTRRRPLLRVDSLRYREVDDVAAALDTLVATGLVKRNPDVPADRWLMLLTQRELREAFPWVRGARKAIQVDATAARYTDAEIRRRLMRTYPVCALADAEPLAAMQLLFFGDAHTDLTTFVLEDLGMLRFEQYPLDPAQRQFHSRADFDVYLSLRACRDSVQSLGTAWEQTLARELLQQLRDPQPRRLLERMRSRLLNELGRTAERAGEVEFALQAYRDSSLPPARERSVRLLTQRGNVDAAENLLRAICAAPLCGTERYFSRHFRAPRIRHRAPAESLLRLPSAPTDAVEPAALAVLTCNGGYGRHLENALPRGLLGLAFWDVLFAPVEAAFVNPYQTAPADLYWTDFRAARAELIARRLDELSRRDELARAVLRTARDKRGIANALVSWPVLDGDLLERAVTCVPSETWIAIFDHMLDDLGDARSGFPDLALFYGARRYQFVEVKGPGDQLRREQRLWFEFFARHQIPACVLRVTW